jgi:hypothetical protein
LAKVKASKAAEVCQDLELSDDALALLHPGLTPGQFLGSLLAEQRFPDAVQFLARALPKREAVWWACECVRAVTTTEAAPPVRAALEAAERWAADPSEENRRHAKDAADTAKLKAPAGCAAMAAFLSEGSLAPPDVKTPVPPAENLTARLVAGAVQLAAVAVPEKANENLQRFMALGQDVAAGLKSWKQ